MPDYGTYKMLTDVSTNNNYYPTNLMDGANIWGIIALILAIVGGTLIYFLFINNKTAPKGKFLTWLKDFLSFKIMWLEPILKIVYYISTIFTILISFSFLGAGGYGFLGFIICLVLGPVFVRIMYEAAIMFIMIWRNTRDIAENTKKK